jgi:2-dehydro-3-deoxyphosphogluconate aldolase/(4S)-4-hydroxy-2-oxoglutarate aldolase
MDAIFQHTAVIPVLTIERVEDAVPLASALVRGGLRLLEVTFRTAAAPAAIAAIVRDVPDAVVGAGTLMRPNDISQALEAGAKFLVSPGLMPDLVSAGLATEVPYIPGVATASEVMAARSLGFSLLKFFPAAAMGGVAYLRALAGPYPMVRYVPTGGITAGDVAGYLALPSVVAVGGTWLATGDLVAAGAWETIRGLASEAAAIVGRARSAAAAIGGPSGAPRPR